MNGSSAAHQHDHIAEEAQLVDRRGKIAEYGRSATGLSALLYNFDVGKATLKPEHVGWLQNNIKRASPSSTLRCAVIGFASRTGKDKFNQSLSTNRALAAQQLIGQLGGPPTGKSPFPDSLAFGETAAALTGERDGYENERWRSVFVLIFEPSKPPPPPTIPPLLPKLRRVAVTFSVDTNVGGALSGGDAGDRAAANSARLAAQMWGVPLTGEFSALVPGNATLSEIRATRSRDTVGLSQVGMPGLLDTTSVNVRVEFVYTVGGPPRPTFNGKPLSSDDLEDWFDNPAKKYLRESPMTGI